MTNKTILGLLFLLLIALSFSCNDGSGDPDPGDSIMRKHIDTATCDKVAMEQKITNLK